MAAPNIVEVSAITGKMSVINLSTTNSTSLVSNGSSSGKVYKINFIRVTNIDGVSAADITVSVSDDGTVGYIAYTISVPADTTLTLIGRDNSFYLEENDSISAQSSVANDLSVVVSYEEVS